MKPDPVSDATSTSTHSATAPGFILERTAKRMKQYFQERLAAAGADITVDQWVILQELNRENGLSQLELARATFKDAPTVTRIIDLLCRKGLTHRAPDAGDRRRFRIELTDAGRHKIGEVLPLVRQLRRTAWQGLAGEEVEHLIETLNKVFENLTEQHTNPHP